jgi:indole-3-glycerol phosphate synthase
MNNVLEKIIEYKRKEVVYQAQNKPLSELEKSEYFDKPCVSAKNFILDPSKNGIIAEFKRKSPSKGNINTKTKVVDVVKSYENHGSSCISILTDEEFFGGSISDLQNTKEIVSVPVLRKEFIVNEYQIYQTKAIGADVILLIAEVLTQQEIKQFTKTAKKIGLEVLLELHSQDQLNKICHEVDIVGINNRDLKTFQVDLNQSIRLLKRIPDQFVKIAESGISSIEDYKKLKSAGFDGFLIGEYFMKEENPALAFENFTNQILAI